MLHSLIRLASSAIVLLLFSMLVFCSDNPTDAIPREARDFADVHWHGDRYLLGLKQVFYATRQDIDSLDPYMDTALYVLIDDSISPPTLRFVAWSHHAFFNDDGSPVGEDEFYDNIGKYHQFNFGWDDFPGRGDSAFPRGPTDSVLTVVSPNREEYLRMWDR